MPTSQEVLDARARAEAKFKVRERRAQQEANAPQAVRDYRAAQQAALDRIPRLRALRLAHEAAQTKKATSE